MRASDATYPGLTRRRLLVTGGLGVGLVVAWAGWPRHYEPNLVAFNFRYEVRTDDRDDPPADPVGIATAKAVASLAEWGLGHKHLSATATDMSQVWSG